MTEQLFSSILNTPKMHRLRNKSSTDKHEAFKANGFFSQSSRSTYICHDGMELNRAVYTLRTIID